NNHRFRFRSSSASRETASALAPAPSSHQRTVEKPYAPRNDYAFDVFIFVEISKATIVGDEQVRQGFRFSSGDNAVKELAVELDRSPRVQGLQGRVIFRRVRRKSHRQRVD
ncbi:hypothetical protein CFP56_007752, partial [Quercus suber]